MLTQVCVNSLVFCLLGTEVMCDALKKKTAKLTATYSTALDKYLAVEFIHFVDNETSPV